MWFISPAGKQGGSNREGSIVRRKSGNSIFRDISEDSYEHWVCLLTSHHCAHPIEVKMTLCFFSQLNRKFNSGSSQNEIWHFHLSPHVHATQSQLNFNRSDYIGFAEEDEKCEKKGTINLSDTVNNLRKNSGCCWEKRKEGRKGKERRRN